jgi:putative membrane protein
MLLGGPALGDAKMQHMKRTETVGSLSLATSRIALKKAEDEDVKEFAQFEVAEQETIADILKSMQTGNVSGTVKPPSESEVEANLDDKGKEMIVKMQQAKAGVAFDREYVNAQVDGHKQLLQIQEDYLKAGKNPEAVAVAKLASGMIKEHLTLLGDIHDNMGRKG